MSTRLRNTVTLNDPRDVLAAVPHLLGFTPTDSLVLIFVRHSRGVPRFGATLRIDLPPPERHRDVGDYLTYGPLRHQEAEGVIAVIVGGLKGHFAADVAEGVSPEGLPHAELVRTLTEVVHNAGMSLLHATWAPEIRTGGRWWCYDEDHCRGAIGDSTNSPLAATMAAAGAVTFTNRQELQGLIAPDSDDLLMRRTAQLDLLSEEREQQRGTVGLVQQDVDSVLHAIRRTAEGKALTEDDHLRVLLALSDHRVRDMALGMSGGEWAHAAEQLWLILVRKAPSPEIAEVAALLAFSAYLRGEGALASVALERIEAVRPDHRLGQLLRRALDCGVNPDELAVIADDAAADARSLIAEEGDLG